VFYTDLRVAAAGGGGGGRARNAKPADEGGLIAIRATRCGVHVRRIHGHTQTVNSIELDFGGSASWVSIAAPTREMRGPHHVGDRDPLSRPEEFTNP
jgi:hypothetical protein